MTAAQEGNAELLKVIVEKGGLKQETLDAALLRANGKSEIVEILKKAGALQHEYKVDADSLKAFAGSFRNEQVGEVVFEVKEGKLRGKVGGQDWFTTAPTDKNTFSIVEVEATVIFSAEGDKITGFTLKQSGASFPFKRTEQK